jgi:peptidoglycan hydrolase-like protein with peptidoglycan-binding domain
LPVLFAAVAGLLALLVFMLSHQTDGRPKTTAPPSSPPDANAGQGAGAIVSAPTLELLRPGDKGEAVHGLQAALVALGFDARTDGLFGDGTRGAVLAFQRARGLTADGVVGGATAEALKAALVEEARAESEVAGQGLLDGAGTGRLSAKSAARYQAILDESISALEGLPASRSAYVIFALRDVSVHGPDYDEKRALTIFTMLEANVAHLRKRGVPARPVDIEGAGGVVYRFMSGHGFQFHPLANFARLNQLAAKKRRKAAGRLAAALVERAVPVGDALIWEYYFPFGGPSRWTSGFAQAVAAQALARTGALLDDPKLFERAKAAYLAIPGGLSSELAGGLWIQEYSFSDMAVLNAQLQTLVSLLEYVEITDDAEARVATAELAEATRALLHRFDTGCWSLYALNGYNASVSYHEYHVSLLKQLAKKTGAGVWRETGRRWESFLRAGPCA